MSLKFRFLFFALLIPFFATAQSAETYKASLSSQSSLILKGKSSLHPFTVKAQQLHIEGSLQTVQPTSISVVQNATAQQIRLRIPVAELASGEEQMDKNLHQDLKGDSNPEITFEMENFHVTEVAGSPAKVILQGTLTIAGVSKPVEIEAQGSLAQDGLRLIGHKVLNMTDYGIKPRKFMMFMKVEPLIDVNFDLVVQVSRS